MALITKRNWKTIIFTDDNGEMTSRVCTKCEKLKVASQFGSCGRGGKRPDCLSCMAKHKAARRKNDMYHDSIILHRHRAKKYGLPSNMSVELRGKVLKEQGYKCPLTSKTDNLSTDHFLPLSWGTGLGDTFENVIFIDANLNKSKGNKNPFSWIRTQPKDIQKRFFNDLIPMLANRNDMTTKEYEEFVHDCYAEYEASKEEIA